MGKIIKNRHIHLDHKKENDHLVLYLSLIIFALSILLYSNTLFNKYALDDFSVIKENWVVKSGTQSIPLIFKTSYRFGYWNSVEDLYRPLSLVLFAIIWQLSPDNPMLYHSINILLYALTGFFLFITLCMIFKKVNRIILFASCLLFIFHPLHSEVVANIKSCDEILSFLFIILTVNCLWKYIRYRSFFYIFFSLIFYLLAFFSKESAITMLAVIPMMIYFFTDLPWLKNIKITLLFLVPALIFLVIRRAVLGNMLDLNVVSVIDNLLIATPDFFYKTATAIKILGIYLLKIIYPQPLVSDCSFNQIPVVSWSSFSAIFSLIIHFTLGIYAIIHFRKKSIISFSILFYMATMSIYSNLFMTIGSSYGERFLYVPVFAFCLILPVLISKVMKIDIIVLKRSEQNPFLAKNFALIVVIIPILALYSFKTISRSREWKNDWSLYSADVINSPRSAHMRYYYGLVLMKDRIVNVTDKAERQKYINLAINEFRTAIDIYPGYADAYDQLGLAYFKNGDNAKAVKCYEMALQFNPTKAITYSNMGVIYFNSGDYRKALELYKKAVFYNPRYADGYLNLGSTYGTLGKYDLAIQSFLKSLEFNPDNAMVYYFLGITYQRTGDHVNEIKYLSLAHKLDPGIKI